MSLFPPGPPVLVGVDAVLRQVSTEALKDLPDPVSVTVGPLDRPVGAARLNWFLYRVTPAPAYANMEFPRTGTTTRRGRPPLALVLHYLLSAEPAELTETGDDETPVHAALSAVMRAVHDTGIFGLDTPVGTGPDLTVGDVTTALDGMVEPLRLTLAPTPLETVTALWTTGSRALRLSVGYEVSLVTVPVETPFVPGPPVLERLLDLAPAPVPGVDRVEPPRMSFGTTSTVVATGVADDVRVTLSRLRGDPDDPTDGRPDPATTPSTGPWVLASAPVPDGLTVTLPGPGLLPGARTLTVTNRLHGRPAGSATCPVTVVPRVQPPAAALVPGAVTTLNAVHVAAPGRLFFGGRPAAYSVASPATLTAAATLTATVPADLPAGVPMPVSVQVGPVTGPPQVLAVAP